MVFLACSSGGIVVYLLDYQSRGCIFNPLLLQSFEWNSKPKQLGQVAQSVARLTQEPEVPHYYCCFVVSPVQPHHWLVFPNLRQLLNYCWSERENCWLVWSLIMSSVIYQRKQWWPIFCHSWNPQQSLVNLDIAKHTFHPFETVVPTETFIWALQTLSQQKQLNWKHFCLHRNSWLHIGSIAVKDICKSGPSCSKRH